MLTWKDMFLVRQDHQRAGSGREAAGDPPLGTCNLLLATTGEERRLPASPLCRIASAVAIPKGKRAFPFQD